MFFPTGPTTVRPYPKLNAIKTRHLSKLLNGFHLYFMSSNFQIHNIAIVQTKGTDKFIDAVKI